MHDQRRGEQVQPEGDVRAPRGASDRGRTHRHARRCERRGAASPAIAEHGLRQARAPYEQPAMRVRAAPISSAIGKIVVRPSKAPEAGLRVGADSAGAFAGIRDRSDRRAPRRWPEQADRQRGARSGASRWPMRRRSSGSPMNWSMPRDARRAGRRYGMTRPRGMRVVALDVADRPRPSSSRSRMKATSRVDR